MLVFCPNDLHLLSPSQNDTFQTTTVLMTNGRVIQPFISMKCNQFIIMDQSFQALTVILK